MPKLASEAIPNELLQYEREKRHWMRKDVVQHMETIDPEAKGVDENTVGRWERGITEPGAYYLNLLTQLYGRSIEELGYVAEDRIPFSNLDSFSLPNPYFTGREGYFQQLHTLPTLRDEQHKKERRKLPLPQRPQALTGLAGIGKTQIALAYAYRYLHNYHTIIWLRADSLQTLRSDFAAIATLLNLPEKQQADQEQIIRVVREWFTHMTRWLLIFDNADNPEDISHFLPSPCYGHVLITTRSQSFASEIGAQPLNVDEMTIKEAMGFLLQRAGVLAQTASSTSARQADQTLARAIAETLGRLPLALDQAGAYIQRTQCGLSRYYDLYQKEHQKLLRYQGSRIAYPYSVASTWSLNFAKVREANPVAIDLLYLMAFLHPDAIPEALLLAGASNSGTTLETLIDDVTSLDLATEELRRYSLVRRNPDAGIYTIHRLVQTVVKDQLSEDTQRQWAERAVQAVNALFPEVTFTSWLLCERYLSHAQTCIAYILQWNIQTAEAARLLDELGTYFLQHGRYSDAENLLKQGLEIRDHLLEPQPLEVARSLVNLGLLSYYQHQDTQSETLYRRALEINEQLPGVTHSALIRILHHLGDLFYNQDRHQEAEAYYLRARTILEQTPEMEPDDLAKNLSGLGLTYYKQEKYAEAEPLLKRALEIYTETFGADHPDVATQLTNLARLYQSQGKYAEAETLFQRGLTIREHALGSSALAVANSLRYLAQCYQDQGQYTDGEPLLKRAATIVRQNLAPDHPFRVTVLQEYHDLLQKIGQTAKATGLKSQQER